MATRKAALRLGTAATALLACLVVAPTADADTLEPVDRRPHRIEVVDLGVSDDSPAAQRINDRGVVVGVSGGLLGARAFRWEDGVVTPLGDLHGGQNVYVNALNVRGQAVGAAMVPDDWRPHAVVWEPDGTVVDLAPDREYSEAYQINRRGTVFGVSGTVQDRRSVVWQDYTLVDLDPSLLGDYTDVFTVAINDNDSFLVSGRDGAGVDHPFIWDDGDVTLLPPLADGSGWSARLINRRGDVAGVGTADGVGVIALWDGSELREIHLPGNRDIGLTDMNDRGVLIGHYGRCGDCPQHGFVVRDGVLSELEPLTPGAPATPIALNARGQIVGRSVGASGNHRAAMWHDGEVIDLGLNFAGSSALDINRRGQVVGYGYDAQGVQHALMWTVR